MYEGLIRSRKWADLGKYLGVDKEEAKRQALSGELADKRSPCQRDRRPSRRKPQKKAKETARTKEESQTKTAERVDTKISYSQVSKDSSVVEASGTLDSIQTLEQLLQAAKVDLNQWEVRHWTANTWTLASGKPAWQVKAYLERILHLEDLGLSVLQAENTKGCASQPPKKSDPKTILYIPDCQIGLFWDEENRQKLHPYHDRLAMNAVWTVAAKAKPDVIVILGDFLDLAIWSIKFAREPKDRYTTKFILDEARWWLRKLRESCPNSRIIMLAGNHEARIDKVLIEYFQEIHSLGTLNIPTMLTLDAFGIEYASPYGKEQVYLMNDEILVEHGSIVRPGGGSTISMMLKPATTHLVQGHVHRIEYGSKTIHLPGSGVKTIFAMSPGCLCRLDGTVPGSDRPDWAHGYGWTVRSPEGCIFTTAHSISSGITTTPKGEIIRVLDPIQDIIKDLEHPLV